MATIQKNGNTRNTEKVAHVWLGMNSCLLDSCGKRIKLDFILN